MDLGVLGGERHRGDLGLVAHLHEEEGERRGGEHAEAGALLGELELVGHQHPGCHGEEGDADRALQELRPDEVRERGAQRAGERVVEQRRHGDARDDRRRPPVLRGQREREKLGLVADFGEGHKADRCEERFHLGPPGRTLIP